MNYQPKTTRDLLTDLGVGRFNATMLTETMMMAPAVTAAASAPVVLLVQHLQSQLITMGAPVGMTGMIDPATDQAMVQIVGSNWLYRTWFDIGRMVIEAKRNGKRITSAAAPIYVKPASALGLFDVNLGLPNVPGGIVTYGVGAFLLYRALKKRKRS